MDIKPRPNHRKYIDILRAMTPAQRLEKSFELTEYARGLMKDGMRARHPEMSEAELHRAYVKQLLSLAGYEMPVKK